MISSVIWIICYLMSQTRQLVYALYQQMLEREHLVTEVLGMRCKIVSYPSLVSELDKQSTGVEAIYEKETVQLYIFLCARLIPCPT